MFFNENKYIIDNINTSSNNKIYTESIENIFPISNKPDISNGLFNENKYIIQEGTFSDAWDTVKKYFRFLYQEFLRYLDKVIDVWVKIQARIKSWLFDADEAKEKLRKKKIEISISEEQYMYIERGIFYASNSVSFKDLADAWYDVLDKAYDDEIDFDSIKLKYGNKKFSINEIIDDTDTIKANFNDVVVKENKLAEFINFCKEGRIEAIKTLQYFRNKLAKGINKFIKAKDVDNAKSKEIAKYSARLRKFINNYISSINKATNAVIKAVNKAKSSNEAKEIISGEKQSLEGTKDNTEKTVTQTTTDAEKANIFIINQAKNQETELGKELIYNKNNFTGSKWDLSNVAPPSKQTAIVYTNNDYEDNTNEIWGGENLSISGTDLDAQNKIGKQYFSKIVKYEKRKTKNDGAIGIDWIDPDVKNSLFNFFE